MKCRENWHERPGTVDREPIRCGHGVARAVAVCKDCETPAAESYRGVPTPPAPLTLAGILGDLDIALARLSTIRAAVNRLPGDRELTVIRLDAVAESLRDAVHFGDKALASWKAGS